MWAALASLLLNKVGQNNAEEANKAQSERQGRMDLLSSQRQNSLTAQQAPVSGGRINLDSIINGVFTKGRQQNQNSIPSGYLGV